MKQEFKILFVEDVPSDAELMERELLNANINFVSKRVDTREHYSEALAIFSPDIIICDHSLPQFDSISAIEILKVTSLDIPFLMVTGSLSDENAVECLERGADDYVLKTNLKR